MHRQLRIITSKVSKDNQRNKTSNKSYQKWQIIPTGFSESITILKEKNNNNNNNATPTQSHHNPQTKSKIQKTEIAIPIQIINKRTYPRQILSNYTKNLPL